MREGRLGKERFGFDMPVDAPLYAKPPIDYRDVHAISVTYETDEDAVLDILPEGLQIDTPALASVNFIHYPFSTLGPYNEAILGIPCQFEGQPRFYIPHIVLDSDIPLAAGREIWGYPKKLAAITIDTGTNSDILWGRMERPAGNPICSAGVRPETPLPVTGETSEGHSMGLRVIPSPTEGEPHSLAELIDVHSTTTVKAHWQGPGWVEFHNHSEIDPWYRLEVKRVVAATYRINDMVLGFGRVVKRY